MKTIPRREYHVRFANCMRHIDGYHKVDKCDFVIHGGIDGYSRLITFMRICDNNRSDYVTDACKQGAKQCGRPQRVRASYGKELLGVREIY
jgi:hypothetical protein